MSSQLVTDAVIAVLEAASLTVGDAQAPDTNPPYVAVYPLVDDGRSGPATSGKADVRHVFQFTCVGSYRREAQWVSDTARDAINAAALSVAGHTVMLIEDAGGGQVTRENPDESPPVFNVFDEYVIWTTPN